MNSNLKGKTFERWVARYLKEHGYNARRGQQYHGGAESPDVVGLDGFHIECKNTQQWAVYKFVEQAVTDSADGEIPIVIAKKNQQKPLVIIRLDDFMEIIGKEDEIKRLTDEIDHKDKVIQALLKQLEGKVNEA